MSKKMSMKMKTLHFIKKYKGNTTRDTIITLIVTILILVAFPLIGYMSGDNKVSYSNHKVFVASLTGDIDFNKYYNRIAKNGLSNVVTKHLDTYLNSSDFITGNVIGTVTQNETVLLKEFGFSNVSTYSKDIADKDTLVNHGIKATGAEIDSDTEENIIFQEINGLKVATIGMTEANYVVNLKWIKKAKIESDLVVVKINWTYRVSKQTDEIQETIAKAIVDAGADVVVGHNIRVVQPIEIYNNKIIFYSLGNFLHGDNYMSTDQSVMIQYIVEEFGALRKINIRVIPLSLANGYPKPALKFYDFVNRYFIFRTLTSVLPKEIDWTVENGLLEFRLN